MSLKFKKVLSLFLLGSILFVDVSAKSCRVRSHVRHYKNGKTTVVRSYRRRV